MKVYKYRSGEGLALKRDLRSLINNEIYSAPIDSLNDIFEAKYILDEGGFKLNLMDNYLEGDNLNDIKNNALDVLNKYIELSGKFGVYSLSKNYGDEILWAYYANSHKGFCLEYELDELVSYRMRDELIIDVIYQKEVPTLTFTDLFVFQKTKSLQSALNKKLIATKSERWSHERELRIVTAVSGKYKYEYNSLKAIYFGCRSLTYLHKFVMKVMKGRGIKYYKMQTRSNSYELERVELRDEYAGYTYKKIELAVVEDGIPYISLANEKYENYFHDAIKIVSELPNSKIISDVDLSVFRGSASNPMIFVIYISDDDKYQKKYFSLAEIDAYFKRK